MDGAGRAASGSCVRVGVTGGGSSRSRLRKLGVVEDYIERHLRLTALLFHQPRIQAIQLAALRVVFDLAIPLCGVAFVQLVQKLAKLRRRKFRDGCFDFGQRAHVGKAALAGPHLQEAGPLKRRKPEQIFDSQKL